MAKARQHQHLKPRLSEESLLTLLGAEKKTLTIKSALDHFAFQPGRTKILKKALTRLRNKGLLEELDNGAFRATQLWSDLALARITNEKDQYGNSYLTLKNLPRAYPLRVTLSKKQMRENKLNTGDHVLVQLRPGRVPFHKFAGVEMVLDEPREITLSGRFREVDGHPHFMAGNRSIKTRFNLHADSKSGMKHNDSCIAFLPHNFDIRNPRIIIPEDQDKAPEAGQSISGILARRYKIDRPHSPAAITEAERIKYHHIPREARLDLTGLKSITIDPPGAQDLDDMLFVEPVDGGWRSVVQIADVSALVHYNGAVDRDAYERGNSFYLPNKTLHMLPGTLTEKCSLLPDQDRPALFAETFYDETGNILNEKIGFGIGRSHAKLSYGEYDDLVIKRDPLVRDIAELHEILRSKTMRGAEEKIQDEILHAGSANFIGNTVVETFMVNVNALLAQTLSQSQTPSLYRNNGPALDRALYEKTRKNLQELSIALPEDPLRCDAETLKNIFDEARQRGIHEHVIPLVNYTLLDRAFYSTQSLGHAALGLPHYTHGTSPIRRYADIIVHRSLRTHLGLDHGLSDAEISALETTKDHLNGKKQLDKDFNRDLKQFYAVRDLKRMEGLTMSGSIVSINDNDIEILLLRDGLTQRISQEHLNTIGYEIDKTGAFPVLRESASGKSFKRNDVIRGRIQNVNPKEGLWSFTPVLYGPQPDTGTSPSALSL